MILTNKQYMTYLLSDFPRKDLITNLAYLSYSNSNMIDGYVAFKESSSKFHESWKSIENFIVNGETSYRDIKISCLSLEEDIYLKRLLKLPLSTKEFKGVTGYIINKVRVFIVEELDRDYQILNFNRNNVYLISIFIGKNFYNDESPYNILKLMYDLAEVYIDNELYKIYNIKFSIYHSESPNKVIVLNDIITPSDIKFIIQYYFTLFKCITDHMICTYSTLFDECDRPVIPICGNTLMGEIMDLGNKLQLEDIDQNNEYTNLLYNEIYSYLCNYINEE